MAEHALEVQHSAQMSPMEMVQKAFDAAITQGAAMEVVSVILAEQR